MKKNVSNKDAYVRYVLATILVVMAYLWAWWLLIPAAIMVVTGYRKVCHVYSLFGCSTCKVNNK